MIILTDIILTLFVLFETIECVHGGHVGGAKQQNLFGVHKNKTFSQWKQILLFSPPAWLLRQTLL